jgi:hypothetical protein
VRESWRAADHRPRSTMNEFGRHPLRHAP